MNATSPRIIIHAGHGKTGTSALQSSLALSQANLLKKGIAYPDHPSFDDARAGKISSGNIEPMNIVDSYDETCARYPDAHSVLYSNEYFFPAIVDKPEFLEPLLDRGVQISAILFIRNPLDHAVSRYVQTIKRRGSTRHLEEELALYDRPVRVLQFIVNARRLGLDLEVLNYSNHKGDLNSVFASTIGVEASDLLDPARPTINRGLTRSELRLQRAFNIEWGRKSSAFVSDPLCNELPDIKAEKPLISRAAYEEFVRVIDKMVADVNAIIPAEERYVVGSYEDSYGDADPDVSESFNFSAEQLDVLARSISARIPQLPDEAAPVPEPAGPPEPTAPTSAWQKISQRWKRS